MTNAVIRAMTLTQLGHGNQKRADVTLLSWLMFLYFQMSVLCIITPRRTPCWGGTDPVSCKKVKANPVSRKIFWLHPAYPA